MTFTPTSRSRAVSAFTALATLAASLVLAGSAATSATAAMQLTTLRVNAGGPAFVDAGGRAWSGDQGWVGGFTSSGTAGISGTVDDAMYQRGRVGMSGYRLPVANGTYKLTVHLVDTFWNAPGQRVFSISAEGRPVATDLDLIRTAGKNAAYRVVSSVAVTDGVLDLAFTARVDNTVVGGIELVPLVAGTDTPPVAPSPSATPTPTPASSPTPTPTPSLPPAAPATTAPANRSGLPWASGVYVPGSTKVKHEAFATWRGRPLDVAMDWSARWSWNDIVNPGWLYDRWVGTPYTKVFSVAMLPDSDASATIAACATGAYNDRWRQFGTNIRAKGLDDESIIRLGWEFNGNWFKWSAHDPAAWAQCWRQIVSSAEATAPALRWDWTVNRGAGQSVTDAARAYPGDDYVDIVGIDTYDGWPGATSEATWAQHYSGPYGLKHWADFAAAHGKKLSVPEWGVYPGTGWAGHSGGDNPFYVAKMTAFFRSMGSKLAYETYFNDSASYYAGSLYAPVQAPNASAEYLRQYRP